MSNSDLRGIGYMGSVLIFLTILFAFPSARAQNMVSNPGFESYSFCSGYLFPQMDSWGLPYCSNGLLEPVAFDTCEGFSGNPGSVPYGAAGYCYPHTGGGFFGFGLYANGSSRGICTTVPLLDTSSILAPTPACLRLWVRLLLTATCTISTLEARLTNMHPQYCVPGSDTAFASSPYVNLDISQVDTTWHLVSADVVLQPGVQYLTIGNLSHDPQDTVMIASGSCHAAYYFDDVYLGLCDVGVPLKSKGAFHLFPDPVVAGSDVRLVLEDAGRDAEAIDVLDAEGRWLARYNLAGRSSVALPTVGLVQGIYVIRFTGTSGTVSRKLVVE